ncbi:XdhC family protein [Litoreibacter arenae]|uniref:Carbon monoxide dehydrogenase F protein n=1 Tax=Litoreibacter arenae DSM 19593 TaxID=1123360 RepID=S9QCR8_9RHOB|nr:XdhC family protein [Litoreibacter arenae]EPX79221.1 Carbon monoxide dehydrogenase F protein [Litoreibacter arenae DSM 19593]
MTTDHSDLNDIPAIALEWHRNGTGAALATVVETWGSAPRPVGSQLAISGQGDIMGSVSGGCVEGAVVVEAMDALDDGTPRLLEYGVSDDEAFAVGLACGGTIRVLVEPVGSAMPEPMLAELVTARAASHPVAYTVDIQSWDRALSGPDSYPDRFRADRSGFEDNVFVAIHNPPLRMAVIGGVHIAQSLLPMARAAGFAPVLIDPREAFASVARFPDTDLVHDWPDAALDAFAIDSRTAVVTLTHDPKIDDPAIQAALASDCFYIGCLGSTRTHAKRVERLRNAGFNPSQIDRIHAPVGLDIGAKSPAEIAISIMAQIIQTLRQG